MAKDTLNNISKHQQEQLDYIQVLNEAFQEEMKTVLLGVYHRYLNDNLTLCHIQETGLKYSLNIEEEYDKMMLEIDGEDGVEDNTEEDI